MDYCSRKELVMVISKRAVRLDVSDNILCLSSESCPKHGVQQFFLEPQSLKIKLWYVVSLQISCVIVYHRINLMLLLSRIALSQCILHEYAQRPRACLLGLITTLILLLLLLLILLLLFLLQGLTLGPLRRWPSN